MFLCLLPLKAAAQPHPQGCLCAPPHPACGLAWEEESGQGSCRPSLLCPQGELVTASKAIIEKEYQPHVIVSTAGPNPFNTLTDRELEEYRREVERKHRGPPGECRGGPQEAFG